MRILKGNPVSRGVALGKVYIYKAFKADVHESYFEAGKEEEFFKKYQDAVKTAEKELDNIVTSMSESSPEKAKILSSIIAYEGSSNGKNLISIDSKNIYTLQVLYRMGYRWPNLSNEYIERFLLSLSGLGFFD